MSEGSKLRLSARMQHIADLASASGTVADIGTDHGYIPVWLLLNSQCRHAIMSDINKGPLKKAAENAALYLSGDFSPDLRLGGGMEVLETGEADTVIIAGMGGLLIKEILEKDMKKTLSVSRFILQPRNNSSELRKFIRSSMEGFKIIHEAVVAEGPKYSEIILAVNTLTYPADQIPSEDLEKCDQIRARLNIPLEFADEFPVLYLLHRSETVMDYLKKRLASEEAVAASIRSRGRGGQSNEKKLEETEFKILNLKKMTEVKADEIISDH